jgi:IS30 family transposase
MKKYKHINQEQRIQIEALLKAGVKISKIAELLEVNRSTIYRELKRNRGKRAGYRAHIAHQLALERKERFRCRRKLTQRVIALIREKLQSYWSPEQIWGYCKSKGICMVSVPMIYAFITEDKRQGGTLYQYLRIAYKPYRRRYGKNKRGKEKITDKLSIEHRPQEVLHKTQIGHWEVDTIVGKNHQGRILTITERKSYFTMLAPIGTKAAADVKKQLINRLASYPKALLSITSDNGTEFALHKQISHKLQVPFYFTHPYSAWEKPIVENINGLIRQFLPKKTADLRNISFETLHMIENHLNKRPRKSLNWKTPLEVFISNFVNNFVALDT